jgi:predicted Zn-dependent protease
MAVNRSQEPMHMRFLPDTDPQLPAVHGFGQCACHPMGASRRLFTGLALAGAASPLLAREGVEVGSTSKFAKLAPAEQVEAAGAQQYAQMMGKANSERALVPVNHPQVQRLRYIGQRLLPFADEWNPRAQNWKWEVNLIASKQINAFCMPGGKIAFFTGILVQLKLDDNEVAAIMGHEIAHALREHARERMGKQMATRVGAGLLSNLLGLGSVGDTVLGMSAQLLSMRWGREDESEADLVGMDLAARGGYDPRAGVSLWQKMGEVNKSAPPQWMSTHPSGPTRIKDIEATLPKVTDLYARASKPDRRFPVATDRG